MYSLDSLDHELLKSTATKKRINAQHDMDLCVIIKNHIIDMPLPPMMYVSYLKSIERIQNATLAIFQATKLRNKYIMINIWEYQASIRYVHLQKMTLNTYKTTHHGYIV